MVSKVAVVEFDEDNMPQLRRALDLIGGIEDLDTVKRQIVVKVGVFSHHAKNHSSVDVVGAIVSSFNRATKIFVAESDNYRGTGS